MKQQVYSSSFENGYELEKFIKDLIGKGERIVSMVYFRAESEENFYDDDANLRHPYYTWHQDIVIVTEVGQQ